MSHYDSELEIIAEAESVSNKFYNTDKVDDPAPVVYNQNIFALGYLAYARERLRVELSSAPTGIKLDFSRMAYSPAQVLAYGFSLLNLSWENEDLVLFDQADESPLTRELAQKLESCKALGTNRETTECLSGMFAKTFNSESQKFKDVSVFAL